MSKKLNRVVLTKLPKISPWVKEIVDDVINISGIKSMYSEMLIMDEVKEMIFSPIGYLDYCVIHDETPTQKGFENFIRETFNVSAELKIKE